MSLKSIWDWVWPIAVGLLVALAIRQWVVDFANVPTSSMAPTIPNPCYILDDHLATEFGSIQRGEVVLFHFPDDPSRIFVKRVIGLPGDTVAIHNDHVYINGKLLDEPYLTQLTKLSGTQPVYHVPADSYFMMGDNRAVSEDSRWWQHPYVKRSAIVGRADFVIWPLSKLGRIQ